MLSDHMFLFVARGTGHFNGKFIKNGAKLAVAALATVLAARAKPRLTLAALLAYAAYFQVYCEPVYQASWTGKFGKNLLPGMMQSKM